MDIKRWKKSVLYAAAFKGVLVLIIAFVMFNNVGSSDWTSHEIIGDDSGINAYNRKYAEFITSQNNRGFKYLPKKDLDGADYSRFYNFVTKGKDYPVVQQHQILNDFVDYSRRVSPWLTDIEIGAVIDEISENFSHTRLGAALKSALDNRPAGNPVVKPLDVSNDISPDILDLYGSAYYTSSAKEPWKDKGDNLLPLVYKDITDGKTTEAAQNELKNILTEVYPDIESLTPAISNFVFKTKESNNLNKDHVVNAVKASKEKEKDGSLSLGTDTRRVDTPPPADPGAATTPTAKTQNNTASTTPFILNPYGQQPAKSLYFNNNYAPSMGGGSFPVGKSAAPPAGKSKQGAKPASGGSGAPPSSAPSGSSGGSQGDDAGAGSSPSSGSGGGSGGQQPANKGGGGNKFGSGGDSKDYGKIVENMAKSFKRGPDDLIEKDKSKAFSESLKKISDVKGKINKGKDKKKALKKDKKSLSKDKTKQAKKTLKDLKNKGAKPKLNKEGKKKADARPVLAKNKKQQKKSSSDEKLIASAKTADSSGKGDTDILAALRGSADKTSESSDTDTSGEKYQDLDDLIAQWEKELFGDEGSESSGEKSTQDDWNWDDLFSEESKGSGGYADADSDYSFTENFGKSKNPKKSGGLISSIGKKVKKVFKPAKQFLWEKDKTDTLDVNADFYSDYEKALALVSSAILKNPQDSELYYKRAKIYYYGLKNYRPALRDTFQCLKILPRHMNARVLSAKALFKLGEFKKADYIAMTVTVMMPEFAQGYAVRSMTSERLGNYDTMLSSLLRASELDSKYYDKFMDAVAVYGKDKDCLGCAKYLVYGDLRPAPFSNSSKAAGSASKWILVLGGLAGLGGLMSFSVRKLFPRDVDIDGVVNTLGAGLSAGDMVDIELTPDLKLQKVLHTGGESNIFEGLYTQTDTKTAVREIGLDLDEGDIEAVFEEINKISILKHPNIANITECKNIGENIYITAEFLNAKPLNSFENLPLDEVKSVFKSVTQALTYLHDNNVVLDGLNADNILIDENGYVKLTDISLKHLKICAQTPDDKTLQMVQKNDIYSLGKILYEIVTGTDISSTDFTAASEIIKTLPPAVDDIIAESLYPGSQMTAADFSDKLDSISS